MKKKITLGPQIYRGCLVRCFEQQFSVFKQYYTYFHIIFHSHVFSKNTNNVTRIANDPLSSQFGRKTEKRRERKDEPSIELHKYPQKLPFKSSESSLLLHLGTEQIINVFCFF